MYIYIKKFALSHLKWSVAAIHATIHMQKQSYFITACKQPRALVLKSVQYNASQAFTVCTLQYAKSCQLTVLKSLPVCTVTTAIHTHSMLNFLLFFCFLMVGHRNLGIFIMLFCMAIHVSKINVKQKKSLIFVYRYLTNIQ